MQTYIGPLQKNKFINICVLMLLFCFFSCSPSWSKAFTANDLLDKLIGKVVFQKPDGIYLIKIGEQSEKHLVDYGSNPRWSSDGKQIAFLHGNRIMLLTEKNSKISHLATASKAKALCFDPDGLSIIFTDNNLLRRVDIKTGEIRTLLKGGSFYEVDIAKDGRRLTATVKTLTGFKVRIFDLDTGSARTVSRGCSASLSPDGSRITVNGKKHRMLHLYQWENLKKVRTVHAPADRRFDNQLWSNNPQWLTSTTEGKRNDIFLHHITSDASYQLTTSGDCDRADLYVSKILP
jgi:WD40 repeat protein